VERLKRTRSMGVRYSMLLRHCVLALFCWVFAIGASAAPVIVEPVPLPTVWRADNRMPFDNLNAAAALAAAPLIVVGTATARQTGIPLGDVWDISTVLYTVDIDSVVYSAAKKPDSKQIRVLVSGHMGLPIGSRVLLSLLPRPHSDHLAGYDLVSRFASIGVIGSRMVSYRDLNGARHDFSTANVDGIACLLKAPGEQCRRQLLLSFGIRSDRQIGVYDELLMREPMSGVYWVAAFARNHQAFPNQLCHTGATGECASIARFRQMAHMLLLIYRKRHVAGRVAAGSILLRCGSLCREQTCFAAAFADEWERGRD
jgi:hypothetical protein